MTNAADITFHTSRLEAIADLQSSAFASAWNGRSVTTKLFEHLDALQVYKGFDVRPRALIVSLERIMADLRSPAIKQESLRDIALGKLEAICKGLNTLRAPPKKSLSPLLLNQEEVQEFKKHLDFLLHTYPTKTIKMLLQPILEGLSCQSLSPDAQARLAQNCLDLNVEICKESPNDRHLSAVARVALQLLACLFRFNSLGQDSGSYYEFAEYYYHEVIVQNDFLKKFKEKLFHKLFPIRFPLKLSKFSPRQLQFHLLRKKQLQQARGGVYNGQMVINPESTFLFQIDPKCIEILSTSIAEIHQAKKPRTQHIVYVHGHENAHSLCIDAEKNPQTGQIEMLCMESAFVYSQWHFLQKLTEKLSTQRIPYHIYACQAGIQKSPNHCILFAFVLSGEIAKVSYDSLRKVKPLDDLEFVHTWRVGTNKRIKLSELPKLCSVTWLPVTAFGEKIIKMGQSITEMRKRWLLLDPNEKAVDAKIEELQKLYEIDREKKFYYMEHRLVSLFMKFMKTPGKDLDETQIFKKLKKDPKEPITRALALRRLAAGQGPKRDMDFLIQRMTTLEINEQGQGSGKTALHWSLAKGHLNRALLLLEHKANASIQDSSGQSAKTAFDTSPLNKNPHLKAILQQV